jgi:hypothetical protein
LALLRPRSRWISLARLDQIPLPNYWQSAKRLGSQIGHFIAPSSIVIDGTPAKSMIFGPISSQRRLAWLMHFAMA